MAEPRTRAVRDSSVAAAPGGCEMEMEEPQQKRAVPSRMGMYSMLAAMPLTNWVIRGGCARAATNRHRLVGISRLFCLTLRHRQTSRNFDTLLSDSQAQTD
eukprot:SAG31_NODE_7957_length_1555_cov_1.326923_2_plen_101_part_00